MGGDIKLYKVPLQNGWFAREEDAKTLEGRLRPDLKGEGLQIVDDFFVKESSNAPTGLSYVLGGYDSSGKMVGASIALDDTFIVNRSSPLYERNLFLNNDAREFLWDTQYVDKFSVAPEKRGNGIGYEMLSKTKFRGIQKGRITFLRTSRDNAHNWYSRFSDFHAKKGIFQVHVFGLDHVRPGKYHEMLEKVEVVAEHIARKPMTSIPIEQLRDSQAATAPYNFPHAHSLTY